MLATLLVRVQELSEVAPAAEMSWRLTLGCLRSWMSGCAFKCHWSFCSSLCCCLACVACGVLSAAAIASSTARLLSLLLRVASASLSAAWLPMQCCACSHSPWRSAARTRTRGTHSCHRIDTRTHAAKGQGRERGREPRKSRTVQSQQKDSNSSRALDVILVLEQACPRAELQRRRGEGAW